MERFTQHVQQLGNTNSLQKLAVDLATTIPETLTSGSNFLTLDNLLKAKPITADEVNLLVRQNSSVNNLQQNNVTANNSSIPIQSSTSNHMDSSSAFISSLPPTSQSSTFIPTIPVSTSQSTIHSDSSSDFIKSLPSATQAATVVEKEGEYKVITADEILNVITEHEKNKPVYPQFSFPNGRKLDGRVIKWVKRESPNEGKMLTNMDDLLNCIKQEIEQNCNLPVDNIPEFVNPNIPEHLKNTQEDTDLFHFTPQIHIPSPQTIKMNIRMPIVDQRGTVYDSLRQGLPPTWEKVFKDSEPHLGVISEVLQKDEQVNGMWYPRKQDLFRAFYYCPLTVPGTNIPYVKAVIIGMDPYPQYLNGDPTYPKATGMSFSIRPDDKIIPKSLNKIFEELEMEYGSEGYRRPEHGDLSDIAVQGVLFLNYCPTFSPKLQNTKLAHVKRDFWKGFMLNVIDAITSVCPNAIFVMWGRDAQNLEAHIPAKMKRLMAMHPANQRNEGFLGCGHFRTINETLKSCGQREIDWQT